MAEQHEELPGYLSRPGYVKGNPQNNAHYIEQLESDERAILVAFVIMAVSILYWHRPPRPPRT